MKVKLALLIYKIISKLSIRTTHRLATVLGTLAYYLPIREKKVTTVNIQQVFPKKTIVQQQYLIKQSLIEGMKSFLESMPIWQLDKKAILNLLTVTGEQHINQNRGVIFVVPHLASWEIVNLWLAIHQPLSSLYRTPKMTEMDGTMKSAREKFGTKMVADNIKGVLQLKRMLDNHGNILIAPDQDPGASGSVMVKFFGLPARTGTLVPKLCQKTNAKVLLIYTTRKQNNFDLHIKPVSDEIYDKNLKIATQSLNNDLENVILKNLEQYSWSYKRYKFQANGLKFY